MIELQDIIDIQVVVNVVVVVVVVVKAIKVFGMRLKFNFVIDKSLSTTY